MPTLPVHYYLCKDTRTSYITFVQVGGTRSAFAVLTLPTRSTEQGQSQALHSRSDRELDYGKQEETKPVIKQHRLPLPTFALPTHPEVLGFGRFLQLIKTEPVQLGIQPTWIRAIQSNRVSSPQSTEED